MHHATRLATRDDEIDSLVDTLLAQPDRADDIKTILRRRLATQSPRKPGRVLSLVGAKADADEEMWDNVPV